MSELEKSHPIMMIDNEDAWLEEEVKRQIWTGPFQKAIDLVDTIYNWGRRSSIWPMSFGLACCAIEMICAGNARYDIARFGAELFRPSPRQADLMIVAGTVTKKMVPVIVRLYNQMAEPKYVMAMGACASAGGPFKEGYNVVSGIDKFLPVDVYVPGCPPTPQALLNGLITLQKKIDAQSLTAVPWYQAESHDAIPEPIYGPDLFDPRRAQEIKTVSSDPELMESRYVRIASRAEVKHGKKEGGAEGKSDAEGKPAAAAKPAARPAAQANPEAPKAAQASTKTTVDQKPASGNPVTPAAPARGSEGSIESNRGEVRPLPPTEPDKLMIDRAKNPPGQIDSRKPALKGLPTAKPENEAKLAELKADADFAAKATKIHEELAKGTDQSKAAAAQIEAQTQDEVRAELQTRAGSDLTAVEPNAGESKEAEKAFLKETSGKEDAQPNPIAPQQQPAREQHDHSNVEGGDSNSQKEH